MIRLTHEPLDPAAALAAVASPRAGAVVLFLGTTRGVTGARETRKLNYECYPEMAERKLAELAAEAGLRWPLEGVAIVYRLGIVSPGEASVVVAVSSPHRREAFDAGRWLIDTLKEVVPIWKEEHWASGETEWVHPGRNPAE